MELDEVMYYEDDYSMYVSSREQNLVFNKNIFIDYIVELYPRKKVKDIFELGCVIDKTLKNYDLVKLKNYLESKFSRANINWDKVELYQLIFIDIENKRKQYKIEDINELLIKISSNLLYSEYVELNKLLSRNNLHDFCQLYYRMFDMVKIKEKLFLDLKRKKKIDRLTDDNNKKSL